MMLLPVKQKKAHSFILWVRPRSILSTGFLRWHYPDQVQRVFLSLEGTPAI